MSEDIVNVSASAAADPSVAAAVEGTVHNNVSSASDQVVTDDKSAVPSSTALLPPAAAVADDTTSAGTGTGTATTVAPISEPKPQTAGDTAAPPAQASATATATATASASTATAAVPRSPQPKKALASPSALIDQANEELAFLLTHGKINQSEVMALQKIVRENATLKEKVAKLKSLLARSAKAQKEAKSELEIARRRLDEANGEVRRLNSRVDSLASRPTHMDLLADFETNFDKALLSIGTSGGQSSGQDPSSSSSKTPSAAAAAVISANEAEAAAVLSDELYGDNAAASAGSNVESTLLLTELSEAKARIDKLESLNAALLARASKLEKTNESLAEEREKAVSKVTNLQLELRMAKMEAEQAARSARERESSLAEMQLEIDLVTKSAMDANVRAAEGMEAVKTVQTDKEHVKELEVKVKALQEWALAAAEAKRVAQERAAHLEEKVRDLTEPDDDVGLGRGSGVGGGGMGSASSGNERRLWSQHSSLVVGAGLVGTRVHVLGDAPIEANESVVLRWKFDLTPSDTDILFSVLKGRWEGATKPGQLKSADAIIRDRMVTGGAAGETTGAFVINNACTLVWSNERSWVRPKTVKYTVEAYAVL
mmetsp:Transcript_32329/g.69989  ORF Transcript_32329/g.69989 Transcript_32329/m.69989 type:complete len:603 (+) Transcript_32329:107-1915(+)